MLKTIPEMISESSMPPLIAELTLKGYEAVKPEVDKLEEGVVTNMKSMSHFDASMEDEIRTMIRVQAIKQILKLIQETIKSRLESRHE